MYLLSYWIHQRGRNHPVFVTSVYVNGEWNEHMFKVIMLQDWIYKNSSVGKDTNSLMPNYLQPLENVTTFYENQRN